MNLLSTQQFLAALNQGGKVIDLTTLKQSLRPLIEAEGDAQMIGEGKRAVWVFDGNEVWRWREYLEKRAALIALGRPGWHTKRPYDMMDMIALVSEGVYDGEIDHPAFKQPES